MGESLLSLVDQSLLPPSILPSLLVPAAFSLQIILFQKWILRGVSINRGGTIANVSYENLMVFLLVLWPLLAGSEVNVQR